MNAWEDRDATSPPATRAIAALWARGRFDSKALLNFMVLAR